MLLLQFLLIGMLIMDVIGKGVLMCEPGEYGQALQNPDPCACDIDGIVNGVDTGRAGCDQHLGSGWTCYVDESCGEDGVMTTTQFGPSVKFRYCNAAVDNGDSYECVACPPGTVSNAETAASARVSYQNVSDPCSCDATYGCEIHFNNVDSEVCIVSSECASDDGDSSVGSWRYCNELDKIPIACVDCEPGESSAAVDTECTTCPLDTFSSEPGASTCESCPDGLRASPGSTSLDDCMNLECYSLTMMDSFGDGWTGNELNFMRPDSGVVVQGGLALEEAEETIDVCFGCGCFVGAVDGAGSYLEEVSWTLVNETGYNIATASETSAAS
ncbi:hypothetical protein TeGR_g4512, partial [Tetraparma gracilis]